MVMQNRVPFTTNMDRHCRIGVLPKRPHLTKDKKCPVQWFELDQPLVILHTINAWQEGAALSSLRAVQMLSDRVKAARLASQTSSVAVG